MRSLQLQACQGPCFVPIFCQFCIPGLVRLASNHLITFDTHTGEPDTDQGLRQRINRA